jgi:hypothetical protein
VASLEYKTRQAWSMGRKLIRCQHRGRASRGFGSSGCDHDRGFDGTRVMDCPIETLKNCWLRAASRSIT